MAEGILQGQMPDLYRPPLYSLFIAPFLHLGGVIYAVQSCLTIGVAVLVFRWTGSKWAALLLACCPFFPVVEFSLRSEALFIPLLVLAWLLIERGKPLWAGLCLGLVILSHDVFLLLPAFALLAGWQLGMTKRFIAVAGAAYLTVLPYMVYNQLAYDRFAISDGRTGFNLWIGTWERDPDWMLGDINNPRSIPDYAYRSPEDRQIVLDAYAQNRDDQSFKRLAVDRIKSDPIGTAQTWSSRYWRLWIGTRTEMAKVRFERGSPAWLAFKSAMWGLNLLLLIGGLWGLWRTRNWLWAIPVAYVALIYAPFHNTEPRYSLPAFALLLVAMGRWLEGARYPAFPLRSKPIPSADPTPESG